MTLNHNYDCSNGAVTGIAGNGFGLCAGGASRHESFNPPLNLNRITNDEYSR